MRTMKRLPDQAGEQKMQLRSGAWCGDKLITLRFPDDWKIIIQGGNPPEPLTDLEIRKRIAAPIGTPALSELAKGKTRVVIVIDDIMRPTPTARILPETIKELYKAGITRKDITIVVGGGSHQIANKNDILRKVGKNLVKKFPVIPHDDMAEDLVFMGHTVLGTPIYVNRIVAQADLKIAIGGIYPHPEAGYSGGAKTLAPGVCGFKTINYLHASVQLAIGQGQLDNQMQEEIVNIAKTIGLDFSVNVILTPDRDIGGVFVGDMIAAHKEGIGALKAFYQVKVVSDADIVISNSYPFDGSYYFFCRGFWPLTTGKIAGAKVLITNGSMTQKQYRFKDLPQSKIDYLHQVLGKLRSVVKAWRQPGIILLRLRKHFFVRRPGFIMFYTGQASEAELVKQFPCALLFQDWDHLVSKLKAYQLQRPVKVAIYPYAALELSHEII